MQRDLQARLGFCSHKTNRFPRPPARFFRLCRDPSRAQPRPDGLSSRLLSQEWRPGEQRGQNVHSKVGGGAKELPNAWVPLAGQPVVTTLRQQQTKGMETLRVKLKWRLSEPKSIKEDTAIQWGESCPVGWVGISVRETWGETLSQQKEQECGQGLRNFPSGAAPGIDKSPRWP